jgi:hypothetical protein
MKMVPSFCQEQFMAQVMEALRDISLYEPDGSRPLVIDLFECGMATASRAKSM